MTKSVLIIDDEAGILEILSEFFRLKGFEVVAVNSGREGLQKFRDNDFSFVISDFGIPDMNGLELCRLFKRQKNDVPVIIISGWNARFAHDAAESVRPDAVLTKPFTLAQLNSALNKVIH